MIKSLVFLALSSQLFWLSGAEYSTQDCRELGFIKTQLLCSSCDNLDFALQELKPICLECCQKDNDSPVSRKYPKAILEVCTCKFGAYPQIQAFVKSDRPLKFPNLQIKYVRGLDPTVKLLDRSGAVKETLSITKWNTDTVQEFFETHLENDESTGDDEEDYLKTNRV
ncbi:selenoprotein F isoform X1 [Lutzomyia longipalpis]|uniref:selenoprotein F isoform X1 n=1 Tax=Lutzomyia longipalpis TaxID=7200 RepID=UPI0024839652|nr:selenoprotein F isoform X1 [Lutzomyia longipalpis]